MCRHLESILNCFQLIFPESAIQERATVINAADSYGELLTSVCLKVSFCAFTHNFLSNDDSSTLRIKKEEGKKEKAIVCRKARSSLFHGIVIFKAGSFWEEGFCCWWWWFVCLFGETNKVELQSPSFSSLPQGFQFRHHVYGLTLSRSLNANH